MAGINVAPPTKFNQKYCWCVTDRKKTTIRYVWTVKKFSQLQLAPGECLESSSFSASETDKNKWSLSLYPTGFVRERTSYVSIFLKFLREIPEMYASFEFSILNKNEQKVSIMKIEKTHNFANEDREFGFARFIRRDELLDDGYGLMRQDNVTFCCEVVIFAKLRNDTGRYDNASLFGKDSGCSQLADDLGRLLNSKHFTDVVLVAEDKELHAHRSLLVARSPVFAVLLKYDMEVEQQSRLVIRDIAYNVLEEIIRFLYTGKVPIMDEQMATGLLAAADRYRLEDLKFMCEQALTLCMNSENVGQLVRLANKHDAEHLKTRLIQYIKSLTTDDVLVSILQDLIIH